jgi:hypothetical protein
LKGEVLPVLVYLKQDTNKIYLTLARDFEKILLHNENISL